MMKNRFEKESDRLLILITAAAVILFGVLFVSVQLPIQSAEQKSAASESGKIQAMDSADKLNENKDFYQQNSQVYDVYLSVFPTPDENGEIMDYSDFAKHQALDHTYNPILDCNIQILNEGEKPDILSVLDQKNATIRVRGNSSRGAPIKNYKVKLDEEAGSFMGQTTLNINKHYKDRLKLTTKFQTDLLAEIDDIASFETYFMRVWVRDASKPKEEQSFEYQGLFTEIEQPNKTYLQKRGLSTNGVLYKAEDFAFLNYDELRTADDPFYNEEEFETRLSICEGENDHHVIVNAVNDINDMNKNFEDTFEQYFDEDNFLTWLCFDLLVQNTDILNHNYLLYNDGYGDKLFFIPWDFDGAMQFKKQPDLTKNPISQQSIQKLNQSILIRRYLRLPGSVEKVRNKLDELLTKYFSEEKVNSLLDQYRPVMGKTLGILPDLNTMRIGMDEYNDLLDNLPAYFARERKAFDDAVVYPVPMFVDMPERRADGRLEIRWDPSYSYQGKNITYSVEIFSDYKMEKKLYEKKDLTDTSVVTDKTFDPGTYFVMVKAIDSDGHEQVSMEHYEFKLDSGSQIYVPGLLQFTVE